MEIRKFTDESEYILRRGRDLRPLARAVLNGRTDKYRMCAFACCKGKIVSVGVNSYIKTHPYQGKLARLLGMPDRMYLHAEIAALLRAKEVDTLYVFRLGGDGFSLAKPCPICQMACEIKGINLVYHT